MIRVDSIKIYYKNFGYEVLKSKISKKLKIKYDDILDIKLIRRSIDARKKPDIVFVCTADIEVKDELSVLKKNPSLKLVKEKKVYIHPSRLKMQPIIIGDGPAGLFAAQIFANAGAKPIIIERGEKIEDRIITVEEFFKNNVLNKESNIQFGEGGAGTFSDGKLNTSVKDFRNRYVLEQFVKYGADDKILYDNKPHIGTDILSNVIINMRKDIESMGGEFKFSEKCIDVDKNNDLIEVITNKGRYCTKNLVFAIGNGAHDTINLLLKLKLAIDPKPFAIGYRVQHPQSMINIQNYGMDVEDVLGPCDYKMTYQYRKDNNNISVYSFCMCPGGYVVNSSSEEGRLVINGMSYNDRNSGVANSAIVMSISFDTIVDALEYRKEIEHASFIKGNGFIPTMSYGDFKLGRLTSDKLKVIPKFKGKYKLCNLRGILPKEYEDAFTEAMEDFGRKIKGFNSDDTIISAIESRTSALIKVYRNEITLCSNIRGIYTIGEGAGHAGGIMSAAIDGIKVAQKILEENNE